MPNITNSWIMDQIEMLWEKCPFKPKKQPFILDPDYFYEIPTYRDKIMFLMKRYNLPFEEIGVYIRANLKEPGRVQLQRVFNTDSVCLQPGQTIVSLKTNGTFAVLDQSDSHSPKIIKVNKSLPTRSTRLSVFLNQDFMDSKEVMGAIIAHEISHLYLYFNGLQKFDSSSELKGPVNEYVTDITAFVIGLGILMLNGCEIKRRTIHQPNQVITEETRLGYLSPDQMRFVQEQILARI